MPNFIRRSLNVLLVLVAACASAGTTGSSGSSNRSLITDAEIPATGTESAYDLIQRLRPEYFRVKPSQTYVGSPSANAPPPYVYVEGQLLGDLSELRRIPAPSLSLIHYYNIEEGKRKFGMQNAGGVIEVTYRKP